MVHAVGGGDGRHDMINMRYDRYTLAGGVGDGRRDRRAVDRRDDDVVGALGGQAVNVAICWVALLFELAIRNL